MNELQTLPYSGRHGQNGCKPAAAPVSRDPAGERQTRT
jgi:hypothetical protein